MLDKVKDVMSKIKQYQPPYEHHASQSHQKHSQMLSQMEPYGIKNNFSSSDYLSLSWLCSKNLLLAIA